MSTIIAINVALATIVMATILGLIIASIATASADRGVTLVRRARRSRLEWATTRPTPPRVARA
jgi:hypothetical protein